MEVFQEQYAFITSNLHQRVLRLGLHLECIDDLNTGVPKIAIHHTD